MPSFSKTYNLVVRGGKLHSTCEVAEFIAFNKVHRRGEAKVEGYLGHKWRISVSFPSSHPYLNDTPD